MSQAELESQGQVVVSSYYVRTRHVMALFADLGPLYVDYYLHLMQNDIRHPPAQDGLLKDALAAIALHLTSRPRDELTAWTVNLNDPVLNLFVTGDSRAGTACGRLFTKDVKVGPSNLFFAQAKRPRLPDRQSTVSVSGTDLLSIVEQYYAQSEQLPARYFRLGGDGYAMFVAQPDHDPAWFSGLTTGDAVSMADVAAAALPPGPPAVPDLAAEPVVVGWEGEELRFLEARGFRFGCGCNLELIHAVIAPMARRDPDELFEGEDALTIQCPRCAGRFKVTRAGMRAWLEANPSE